LFTYVPASPAKVEYGNQQAVLAEYMLYGCRHLKIKRKANQIRVFTDVSLWNLVRDIAPGYWRSTTGALHQHDWV
jgi:hypothetical protein